MYFGLINSWSLLWNAFIMLDSCDVFHFLFMRLVCDAKGERAHGGQFLVAYRLSVWAHFLVPNFRQVQHRFVDYILHPLPPTHVIKMSLSTSDWYPSATQ